LRSKRTSKKLSHTIGRLIKRDKDKISKKSYLCIPRMTIIRFNLL